MIHSRRERAFGLGQEELALRLLFMKSLRMGALASIDDQIRQARAILGGKGKGC